LRVAAVAAAEQFRRPRTLVQNHSEFSEEFKVLVQRAEPLL